MADLANRFFYGGVTTLETLKDRENFGGVRQGKDAALPGRFARA